MAIISFLAVRTRAPSFHVTSLNFLGGGDLSAYFRNENLIHHGCEDVDDDVLSEGVCHFFVKAHQMKLEGFTCGEGFVNTKKYQRGDRGLLVFTFFKNKKSSKAKAKKIRNKKIFQPRLKGNQYFGGLPTKHP